MQAQLSHVHLQSWQYLDKINDLAERGGWPGNAYIVITPTAPQCGVAYTSLLLLDQQVHSFRES